MDGVMAVETLAREPQECGCDGCLLTQKNLVLHGHMQARVHPQVWKPDARRAMMLHHQFDLLSLVELRPFLCIDRPGWIVAHGGHPPQKRTRHGMFTHAASGCQARTTTKRDRTWQVDLMIPSNEALGFWRYLSNNVILSRPAAAWAAWPGFISSRMLRAVESVAVIQSAIESQTRRA